MTDYIMTDYIRITRITLRFEQHISLPVCLSVDEVEKVITFAHRRENKQRPSLKVESFSGNAACGPYIELSSPWRGDVEDVTRMIMNKILRMTDNVEVKWV